MWQLKFGIGLCMLLIDLQNTCIFIDAAKRKTSRYHKHNKQKEKDTDNNRKTKRTFTPKILFNTHPFNHVYIAPKNRIFTPDDHLININKNFIDINKVKRDFLIFPTQSVDQNLLTQQVNQLLQNQLIQSQNAGLLPKPLSEQSAARRLFYDDAGAKNPSDQSFMSLPPSRISIESGFQQPQESEPIANNPLETSKSAFYDDNNVPSEYREVQGVQETEEDLVGKLLRNTPKGLQPPGKAALKSQEPSFEPPSMVQLDSATIEKMLNQNKDLSDGDDKNHDTNINCVPLPRPENCSHSDDPMCHDEDISKFRYNGLKQHERYRAIHHTPPLELNDLLNQEAQNYSERLASEPKLAYSDPKDRPGQGENIAVRCSDDGSLLTAKEAVSYWYDKVCKNNFDFEQFSPEISQFAQVVWKDSNYLGLGRTSKLKGGLLCTYIVARYSPQATKEGFIYNVPRGNFDEKKVCSKRCGRQSPDTPPEFQKNKLLSGSNTLDYHSSAPSLDLSPSQMTTPGFISLPGEGNKIIPHNPDSDDHDPNTHHILSNKELLESHNSPPKEAITPNTVPGSPVGLQSVEVPMYIKPHSGVIIPSPKSNEKSTESSTTSGKDVVGRKETHEDVILVKPDNDATIHKKEYEDRHHKAQHEMEKQWQKARERYNALSEEKEENKMSEQNRQDMQLQKGQNFLSRIFGNNKDGEHWERPSGWRDVSRERPLSEGIGKAGFKERDEEINGGEVSPKDDQVEDSNDPFVKEESDGGGDRYKGKYPYKYWSGGNNTKDKDKEKEKQKQKQKPKTSWKWNGTKFVKTEKLNWNDEGNTERPDHEKIVQKLNEKDGKLKVVTNKDLDKKKEADEKAKKISTSKDEKEFKDQKVREERNNAGESSHAGTKEEIQNARIKEKLSTLKEKDKESETSDDKPVVGLTTESQEISKISSSADTNLPSTQKQEAVVKNKEDLKDNSDIMIIINTTSKEQAHRLEDKMKQLVSEQTGLAKPDNIKVLQIEPLKKIAEEATKSENIEIDLPGPTSKVSPPLNPYKSSPNLPSLADGIKIASLDKVAINTKGDPLANLNQSGAESEITGLNLGVKDEMEAGDQAGINERYEHDFAKINNHDIRDSSGVSDSNRIGVLPTMKMSKVSQSPLQSHSTSVNMDALKDLNILEQQSAQSTNERNALNPAVYENGLGDAFTRQQFQNTSNITTPLTLTTPAFLQLIPTQELNEFRREILDQHNRYRKIHNVPPLSLDHILNKDAQIYAAYVAKRGSVAHSDPKQRPNTGESVAEMCTKEGVLPTPEHVVNKWYSEICNPGFDFQKRGRQTGTGHFTQIIWKDTSKLGVGLAVANHPSGESCSYVVARYKNAGNYIDKFNENVFPGSFARKKCTLDAENEEELNMAGPDKKNSMLKTDNNQPPVSLIRSVPQQIIQPINPTNPPNQVLSRYSQPSNTPMLPPIIPPSVRASVQPFQVMAEVEEDPQSKSTIYRNNELLSPVIKRGLSSPMKLKNQYAIPYNFKGDFKQNMKTSLSNVKRNMALYRLKRSKDEFYDTLYKDFMNFLVNEVEVLTKRSGIPKPSNSSNNHITQKNFIVPKSSVITHNSKILKLPRLSTQEHLSEVYTPSKSDGGNILNSGKRRKIFNKQNHQESSHNPVNNPVNITQTVETTKRSSINKEQEDKKQGKHSKKKRINTALNLFLRSQSAKAVNDEIDKLLRVTSKKHKIMKIKNKRKFKRKTKGSKRLTKSLTKNRNITKMSEFNAKNNKTKETDEDDDLETYLRNIVVKLHALTKKANVTSQEDIKQQMQKFAELNAKALKSGIQTEGHGPLNKQSVIPSATRNLESFLESRGSKRILDIARKIQTDMSSDVKAYLKGLNAISAGQPLSAKTSERLIKINNMLQPDSLTEISLGPDAVMDRDYLPSQSSYNSFDTYDQQNFDGKKKPIMRIKSILVPSNDLINGEQRHLSQQDAFSTEELKDSSREAAAVENNIDPFGPTIASFSGMVPKPPEETLEHAVQTESMLSDQWLGEAEKLGRDNAEGELKTTETESPLKSEGHRNRKYGKNGKNKKIEAEANKLEDEWKDKKIKPMPLQPEPVKIESSEKGKEKKKPKYKESDKIRKTTRPPKPRSEEMEDNGSSDENFQSDDNTEIPPLKKPIDQAISENVGKIVAAATPRPPNVLFIPPSVIVLPLDYKLPPNDIGEFEQSALMAHNKLRQIHYAPALSLSERLTKEAQDYAQDLVLKHQGVLKKSPIELRGGAGENLIMNCDPHDNLMDGEEAAYKWYAEVCQHGYDFTEEPKTELGTDHFTQLVWKESKYFGIGRAVTKRNKMTCSVIVARYQPSGNVPGEYLKNVDEGVFDGTICEKISSKTLLDTDTEAKQPIGSPITPAPSLTLENKPNNINGNTNPHLPFAEPESIPRKKPKKSSSKPSENGKTYYVSDENLETEETEKNHKNKGFSDETKPSLLNSQKVPTIAKLKKAAYEESDDLKSVKVAMENTPEGKYVDFDGAKHKPKEKNLQRVSEDDVAEPFQDTLKSFKTGKTRHAFFKMEGQDFQENNELNQKDTKNFYRPVAFLEHDKTPENKGLVNLLTDYGNFKVNTNQSEKDQNDVYNIHMNEKAPIKPLELQAEKAPMKASELEKENEVVDAHLPEKEKPKETLSFKNVKQNSHHRKEKEVTKIKGEDNFIVEPPDSESKPDTGNENRQEFEKTVQGDSLTAELGHKNPNIQPVNGSQQTFDENTDEEIHHSQTAQNMKSQSDIKKQNKIYEKLIQLQANLLQKANKHIKNMTTKLLKETNKDQPSSTIISSVKVEHKPIINPAISVPSEGGNGGDEPKIKPILVNKKPVSTEQKNDEDENELMATPLNKPKPVQTEPNIDGDESETEPPLPKPEPDHNKGNDYGNKPETNLFLPKPKPEGSASDNSEEESEKKPEPEELQLGKLEINNNESKQDKKPSLAKPEPAQLSLSNDVDETNSKPSLGKIKHENSGGKPNEKLQQTKPLLSIPKEMKTNGKGQEKIIPAKPAPEPVPIKPENDKSIEESRPKFIKLKNERNQNEEKLSNDEEDKLGTKKLSNKIKADQKEEKADANQPDFKPTQPKPEPLKNERDPATDQSDAKPKPIESDGKNDKEQPITTSDDSKVDSLQTEKQNDEKVPGIKPSNDEGPIYAPTTPDPVNHVKPLYSSSPTSKPSYFPHGKPISSSVDLNQPYTQNFGVLPSFSYASFGSPVILHLGATGFYEDPAAFLRIGLTTHNKLRQIHGAPPLMIDPMLTMEAYQYAMELTDLGYLKHQKHDKMLGAGENLLLGCYDGDYDISAEEAVMRWYGEVCHPGYCFNKSTTCSGTGHFTQVVWKESIKLGMAKATRMQNGLRCTYIVARYFPSGNENMFYNENVQVGMFREKEVCMNVFKSLVSFDTRNPEKAKMVDTEKNLARIEFLKNLKEIECQVSTQLLKETSCNPNLPPVVTSNMQSLNVSATEPQTDSSETGRPSSDITPSPLQSVNSGLSSMPSSYDQNFDSSAETFPPINDTQVSAVATPVDSSSDGISPQSGAHNIHINVQSFNMKDGANFDNPTSAKTTATSSALFRHKHDEKVLEEISRQPGNEFLENLPQTAKHENSSRHCCVGTPENELIGPVVNPGVLRAKSDVNLQEKFGHLVLPAEGGKTKEDIKLLEFENEAEKISEKANSSRKKKDPSVANLASISTQKESFIKTKGDDDDLSVGVVRQTQFDPPLQQTQPLNSMNQAQATLSSGSLGFQQNAPAAVPPPPPPPSQIIPPPPPPPPPLPMVQSYVMTTMAPYINYRTTGESTESLFIKTNNDTDEEDDIPKLKKKLKLKLPKVKLAVPGGPAEKDMNDDIREETMRRLREKQMEKESIHYQPIITEKLQPILSHRQSTGKYGKKVEHELHFRKTPSVSMIKYKLENGRIVELGDSGLSNSLNQMNDNEGSEPFDSASVKNDLSKSKTNYKMKTGKLFDTGISDLNPMLDEAGDIVESSKENGVGVHTGEINSWKEGSEGVNKASDTGLKPDLERVKLKLPNGVIIEGNRYDDKRLHKEFYKNNQDVSKTYKLINGVLVETGSDQDEANKYTEEKDLTHFHKVKSDSSADKQKDKSAIDLSDGQVKISEDSTLAQKLKSKTSNKAKLKSKNGALSNTSDKDEDLTENAEDQKLYTSKLATQLNELSDGSMSNKLKHKHVLNNNVDNDFSNSKLLSNENIDHYLNSKSIANQLLDKLTSAGKLSNQAELSKPSLKNTKNENSKWKEVAFNENAGTSFHEPIGFSNLEEGRHSEQIKNIKCKQGFDSANENSAGENCIEGQQIDNEGKLATGRLGKDRPKLSSGASTSQIDNNLNEQSQIAQESVQDHTQEHALNPLNAALQIEYNHKKPIMLVLKPSLPKKHKTYNPDNAATLSGLTPPSYNDNVKKVDEEVKDNAKMKPLAVSVTDGTESVKPAAPEAGILQLNPSQAVNQLKNVPQLDTSMTELTQTPAANQLQTTIQSAYEKPILPEIHDITSLTESTKNTPVTSENRVTASVDEASAPGETASPMDVSAFELSALNAHNTNRRIHGVPLLHLNEIMSKEATEYAKSIAKLKTLRHSGTEDGENIASVCREKNILMTGQEATTIWYREVCDPGYDFSTAEPGKAGHFTQVIWKSTTDFGIGRAAAVHDGLLCTYIVARYRPAGNFLGEFPDNVPKGQFSAEQCVNLAKKRESINKPTAMKRSGIPKIHLPRSIFQKEAELSGKYRQEVTEISPALKYKKTYVVGKPYSTSHHSELRKRLFKASKKNEFPLRVITPVSLINVPSDQIVMNYAANIKYEWMNPKQNSKKLFMKEESSENNNEQFAGVRNPDDSEGPVSVDLLENGENRTISNFLYNNTLMYDHVMKETQPRTYSNNANIQKIAFSRYSLRNHNKNNVNRYEKNGTRYTNRSTVSGKHILCSYQNESIPMCNPSIQPGASGTTTINLFSKMKLSPQLQNYKQHPMVEKKSTASNLSFGTNNVLPRDLSIDSSAIHNNQDLIKMAKIGIIALKLAKKAALEKKYSQSINKKERDLLITALASPETTNAFLNSLNSTNLLGTLPDLKNVKKSPNINNGPYVKSLRNYSNNAIRNQSKVFPHSELLSNNNKAHDLKNTLVGSKKDFGSAHPTPDSKARARDNEQIVMVQPTNKQSVIKATVNSFSTGSPDSSSLVSQEHLVQGIISKLSKPVQEAKEVQTELEPDDKYSYSEFEEAALNTHNVYRNVHQAEPLVLDRKLAQEATRRATLIAAVAVEGVSPKKLVLQNGEGENVAVTCKHDNEKMTGPDATSMWYNEVCSDENTFSESPSDDLTEFNQLVSKTTEKLGIGRANFDREGKYCTVIVARYYPGLDKNSVRGNVIEGIFDRKSYCNGLGALVDTANGNGYNKRSNGITDELTINVRDFRQEAINLQNQFRAIHGVSSIDLDPDLCKDAESYASELSKKGSIEKSTQKDGESIIKSCNGNNRKMNADEAIRKWYNEICNPGYSFDGEEKNSGATAFTQMVWKDTNAFGIGRSFSKEDGMLCTYIVGRYRGKGNIDGAYARNVIQGAFDFGYCDSLGKPFRKTKVQNSLTKRASNEKSEIGKQIHKKGDNLLKRSYNDEMSMRKLHRRKHRNRLSFRRYLDVDN